MAHSLIFMFSGQGSHYYHMGKELIEHHSGFRRWMLKLNDLACKTIGASVVDYIYDTKRKKSDIFDSTLYSSLSIFMIEYALAQTLIEENIKPDFVLGASLGEFVAAAVAGVMNIEEILPALVKHADIMESLCPPGGMMAILENPRLFYELPILHKNSELAGINYNSHFVISGKRNLLMLAEDFLKEKGVLYQVLPVSRGFHSALMDPASTAYKNFLKNKSFNPPQIPYISCTSANIVKTFTSEHLWDVTRKPIEFQKTVHELEKTGSYLYLDLGPSGTLATFVKYNLSGRSQSKSLPLLTPFGQDLNNLETVRQSLMQ